MLVHREGGEILLTDEMYGFDAEKGLEVNIEISLETKEEENEVI